MHKFLKQVSIGLVFILFFTLMPIPAIASELKTIAETNKLIDAPPIEQSEKKEADIIGEVKEKRGKNIKHFLKEDMSIEENIYPTAVHYLSDGKWKDIDNSLSDKKDEDNNDVLENKDNDYKIKVAKNTKSNKLIRIQKDKYEVSWNIENAQHSLAQVQSTDGKAADSQKKIKKNILTNLTSTINFLNIFPNTDIQYIVASEDVKENIILNQSVENPQYVFNINTKNLTSELQKDNSIIFYDEKDTTKAVFKIEKPVMYDSGYGDSNNIKLILDKSGNGYKLTIIPDNEWLQSPDRVYPVIIDPQITTTQDKTTIQDTYVSEAKSNN